ncbi:MAG: thioredoxin-like domain-containing protein [bacterium]|jgi:thiol-disulfide isomerase/thioredoxin
MLSTFRKASIGFMLLSGVFAHAQEGTYRIRGTVSGLDTRMMYLNIQDASAPGGYLRDSIPVKDGSFRHSGPIRSLTYVTLSPNVDRVVKWVGRGYYPAKSSLFQFFLFPGADVVVEGSITDMVNAYPSGDPANIDLGTLTRSINPLQNQSVNLSVRIGNKEVTDSVAIARMKDTIAQLDARTMVAKKAFLLSHPSSAASAWLLSDMMIRSQVEPEEAIKAFRSLQVSLSDNPYYQEVASRVKGIEQTRIGKLAPAIESRNTPDSALFSLASFRGRYVVIDFWGTWCGPCIAGMPRMKQMLDKYKGKMEIVGVAQESDGGGRWRKFLKDKPEYGWHHVLNTKSDDIILKYNVAGYPTKIILSPEGKILYRFVGEDDSFYTDLEKLLN